MALEAKRKPKEISSFSYSILMGLYFSKILVMTLGFRDAGSTQESLHDAENAESDDAAEELTMTPSASASPSSKSKSEE